MSSQILMPVLPNREDGRLTRWHVAEGQRIAAGDVIAEIETASSTLEIEAAAEGTIARILVPAGLSVVKTHTPLAVVMAREAGGDARAPPTATGASAPNKPVGRSPAAPPVIPSEPPLIGRTREISYREAMRDALSEEMSRDPNVFLIGFDIAHNSGAPEITQGLADRFGPERVVSAPDIETAYTALAIGAAYTGLRPVVLLPAWGRSLGVLQALVTSAAGASFLSGARLKVPIVLLAPDGPAHDSGAVAGLSAAAWLAHIPGLRVAAPATPATAKGLLKAAIREPGPVALLTSEALLEHVGTVPADTEMLAPLGKARIARKGRSVTLATYGASLPAVLAAADELMAGGIDAEVVDLVSLKPLDMETVLASVGKTGRLVTVEAGWPQGSIGSEIIARVATEAPSALASPPVRLAGADCPLPHAESLRRAALPGADAITAAVRSILNRESPPRT